MIQVYWHTVMLRMEQIHSHSGMAEWSTLPLTEGDDVDIVLVNSIFSHGTGQDIWLKVFSHLMYITVQNST